MDLETGEEVYHAPIPRGLEESVTVAYELAYSPDGSQLVVLNTSKMHVLNAETRGEPLRRYTDVLFPLGDAGGWLTAIGFGAQGEIYVVDLGGWLHSFATISSTVHLANLGLAGAVDRIEPIPESSDLLLSHFGAVIRFNTETKAQTVLNDPEFHPVNAIDLSPDGLTMAWGGDDEWWLVDLESGDTLMESTVDYTPDTWSERIYSINFSPDGTQVATLQTDGQLRVWDIETGESVLVTRFNNGVNQRWG
jgi:WD40 repeat protein